MLLLEMQNNIKELEQLSEGLQGELAQKEELYSHLKGDYQRLEAQYTEAIKMQGNIGNDKDRKLNLLEDEINYVKKHSEIEVGLIKDENEILKKELNDLLVRQEKKDAYYNLTPN